MKLGENVRVRRVRLGMSGKQLADQVGITEPMISHIERGLKMPSVAVCVALAHTLGCTLDDLVMGSLPEGGIAE